MRAADCASGAEQAVYRQRLKGLQRIRESIGSRTELCLPRIVVVGDQSSGKSSALERLTGIRFPSKSGICTKAAIVAECTLDESLAEDCFELRDAAQKFQKVAIGALPGQILERQEELLEMSGGKKVCTEEISVRVSGPRQMDIIVIDLPGIIHTGEGKEETRELINKYIKRPETLIMLVSEATRNDETMEAIEMAHKVDPDGKRTLRVLTKFDSFDSQDSKQTAVALVMKDHAVLEMGRDHDATTKLSPHAVICMPDGQARDYCGDDENKKLLELGLHLDRAGVSSLKERLPPIFAGLIQSNLPEMLHSINQQMIKKTRELQLIGEVPVSRQYMIARCQSALVGTGTGLQPALTIYMSEFKETLHAMEKRLEKQWVFDKMQENVFSCVAFQGEDAFGARTRDVVEWWRPLLATYIKRVQSCTLETLHSALAEVDGVPGALRKVAGQRMEQVCTERIFVAFSKSCLESLEMESGWGTVNHYFNSKFEVERQLPKALIDEFVDAIKEDDCYTKSPDVPQQVSFQLQHAKVQLRKLLIDRKAMHEAKFGGLSLHDQQRERVFLAVTAWYTVEKKTFTDIVLKATKTHILDAQRQWVLSEFSMDSEVLDAAVEDEQTCKERVRLKDLLARLEQCLAEVKGMM